MEIRNKTALITGGARRIGREIALGLAKEGVNILLHYNTSEEDAIKTREEIKSHGVDCWLIKGDLSQEYSTLIEKGFNIVSEIDFLINNASIFPLRTFEEIT
ncbi:dehydrogenase, partial [Sulfolobus sp. E5]